MTPRLEMEGLLRGAVLPRPDTPIYLAKRTAADSPPSFDDQTSGPSRAQSPRRGHPNTSDTAYGSASLDSG